MKGRSQRRSTQPMDVVSSAAAAYEHGYLRVLLEGPPLAVRLRQLADSCQLASYPRLLLLCPTTGQTPEDASRLDSGRLVSVGQAEVFSHAVAGARSRQYGSHPVFRVRRGSGTDGEQAEERLVAVEAVGSLRTLLTVGEEMARCPRQLPPLDAAQLAGQFAARLRHTVETDERMQSAFRVVEYDPRQAGALERAVQAAAFETAADVDSEAAPGGDRHPAPAPVGIGVYLAWSFVHGYLKLAVKRDVPAELDRLASESGLALPVRRVVVLCPTGDAEWSDDISQLDGQLQPLKDVAGVKTDVPALGGRTYGSFSLYRCGAGCYALELATPLRTLRLSAGGDTELYQREARSFVKELRELLRENPAVSAHYALLEVEGTGRLCRELERLASAPATPAREATGFFPKSCSVS